MNEANPIELLKNLQDAAFVLKTQQQIAKDFGKVQLNFPGYFVKEALVREKITNLIAGFLSEQMKISEQSLLQLLYVIDIPEKLFFSLVTQDDFIHQMADQILLREAHKVWMRDKYARML